MSNVKDDISKKVDEKIARLSSEEQSFEERFARMQREKELQREQLREKREREDAQSGRKRAGWRKRLSYICASLSLKQLHLSPLSNVPVSLHFSQV